LLSAFLHQLREWTSAGFDILEIVSGRSPQP
jgi:hypothetical protein